MSADAHWWQQSELGRFAHAALVALLAKRGVAYLRVHDVRATCDALAVVRALSGAGSQGTVDRSVGVMGQAELS